MENKETPSLIGTNVQPPVANAIATAASSSTFPETISGPQTSISLPANEYTGFTSIPRYVLKNWKRKLKTIKNPSEASKWPDLLCGLSCTGLGTILGAALSKLSPFNTFNFLLYIFAIILMVGCGAGYFICRRRKTDLDYELIAQEVLQDFPILETLNINSSDGNTL